MIEIDANEHIIRVVRKHWFVLLGEVLILTFAVFLPGILLFVLHLVPLDQIFAFDGSTLALGGFLLF